MKEVRVCLGRFQPFTLGHLKMATYKCKGPETIDGFKGPVKQQELLREQPDIDVINKQKTLILVIKVDDDKIDKRHPFPYTLMKEEMDLVKSMPDIEDVLFVESADICAWGEMIKQKGYKASVWLTGSDEAKPYVEMAMKVPEYEEHNRDNRDCKDAYTKSFYVESIERDDNASDFTSTISGTKVRQALKDNDEDYFKKAMPKGCDKLFAKFKEAIENPNLPDVYKKSKKKIKEYLNSNIKTIAQYINEQLVTEGGHSVEGAEPIKGNLAKQVADEIVEKLKKKFGNNLLTSPLGSTGKKTEKQTSGDIDIAIEIPWKDHQKVYDFVYSEFNPVPGNTVESLRVFNIGYRYNDDGKEKIVQVDFMFVDNIEFAQFCFHSPSFIPDKFGKIESAFKGAFRTQLMIACVNSLDAEKVFGSEYKPEYFTKNDYDGSYDKQVKTMWRVIFSKDDGMKLKQVSYEGKTKPVKAPKTIKSESKSKDINNILKICFGSKATKETMNSYESIIDFIFSEDYKWRSKELLMKIEDWLFPEKGYGALVGEKPEMIDMAKKYYEEKLKELK